MKNILFILLMLLVSCGPCIKEHQQHKTETRKLELIGYRIAKHSKMRFRDLTVNKIVDFNSIGGRKKPTIELGTVIEVKVCTEHSLYLFEPSLYTVSAYGETRGAGEF